MRGLTPGPTVPPIPRPSESAIRPHDALDAIRAEAVAVREYGRCTASHRVPGDALHLVHVCMRAADHQSADTIRSRHPHLCGCGMMWDHDS